MASIAISEFRRRCLTLLEQLPAEGLTVTKRGQPIARVAPVRRNLLAFVGSIPDLVCNPTDDLLSTGVKWDAQSRHPHRNRRRTR